MSYLIFFIIIFLIYILYSLLKNKKETNLNYNFPPEPVSKELNPFEAAQEIKELYVDARKNDYFDRNRFDELRKIKNTPLANEMALQEINKREVIDAINWYINAKGYLKFWFSDEVYNTMVEKINNEFNPDLLNLNELTKIFDLIQFMKLFVSEDKYKEILKVIFNKQEQIYLPEAINIETPIKASLNIRKHQKKYTYFSPYLISIADSFSDLNGYKELDKRKQQLKSKQNKFLKSENIEKLNKVNNEIEIIKKEIQALMKYEIELLKNKHIS